jgi:hypothetical protein
MFPPIPFSQRSDQRPDAIFSPLGISGQDSAIDILCEQTFVKATSRPTGSAALDLRTYMDNLYFGSLFFMPWLL